MVGWLVGWLGVFLLVEEGWFTGQICSTAVVRMGTASSADDTCLPGSVLWRHSCPKTRGCVCFVCSFQGLVPRFIGADGPFRQESGPVQVSAKLTFRLSLALNRPNEVKYDAKQLAEKKKKMSEFQPNKWSISTSSSDVFFVCFCFF